MIKGTITTVNSNLVGAAIGAGTGFLIAKKGAKLEKTWQTDRSEAIRRLLAKALDDWKVKNALERLRENKLSIGKAADECGIPLWEMLDLARKENIDWTGYSDKDLEKDLRVIN